MALLRLLLRTKSFKVNQRFYSDDLKLPPENPFTRLTRLLGNDLKKAASKITGKEADITKYKYGSECIDNLPSHCDVVIIGGGVMGSSIAYYIKEMARKGLSVAVIEKDPSYTQSSTVLSVGGLRQQFSLPENILMSQYGAEFFRTIKKTLGDDVDVQFTPHGYLLLANEENAHQLESNYKIQQKLNVRNELLRPDALKQKFPWLNTDGIALGCHGLENEGWFDPWTLLCAFKRKAIELGADYVNAEAVSFEFEKTPNVHMQGVEEGSYEKLSTLYVKHGDIIRPVQFAICVLAAGAESGEIAKLARIGTGKGILSIPLPVERRKRYVYCFNTQDPNMPGLNTPMTFDPSGTYFRREGLGNNFIAGRAPQPGEEPDTDNLDVDYNFFDTNIWPHLAERVPAFSGVKVNSAWAGYYEFNTYDENGIIGFHPYYNNLCIATGFSGHGIQQSPAVGQAVAELILDGSFLTIDLTRLGFDRMILNRPMYETNIF